MSDLETKFVTMYRVGYLEADVPEDIMELLRSETEEMEKTNFSYCIPYNDYLVGNIQREYIITKSASKLNDYIAQIAHAYYKEYGGSEGRKFEIPCFSNSSYKDIWVNFQKKHEFNPVH